MAAESGSALIPTWPQGAEPKWLTGPLVGARIVLWLVQDLAASSIPFTLEAADSGGVWRFGAGQAPDPLSPWGEGRGCPGPFYLDAFGKTPGASASYPQALCLALSLTASRTALTALGIGCATAAEEGHPTGRRQGPPKKRSHGEAPHKKMVCSGSGRRRHLVSGLAHGGGGPWAPSQHKLPAACQHCKDKKVCRWNLKWAIG